MGWFSTNNKSSFNWLVIQDDLSYGEAIQKSYEEKVLIFKHSTRCSISSMALNRIESNEPAQIKSCYYLDLIKYRSISNKIEVDFQVKHESPQVLIIENGKCIYHTSHNDISWSKIP